MQKTPLANALRQIPSRYESPSTGLNLPNLLGMDERQREAQTRRGAEASALREVLEAIRNDREPSAIEKAVAGWLKRTREHAGDIPGLPEGGALRAAADTLMLTTGGASAGRLLPNVGKAAGAAKAVRASQRVVRTATRARAAKAVQKVPKPVRKAGRVTGRAATVPARHPFLSAAASPVLAELPSGDPKRILRGLEGTGVVASTLTSAARDIGNAVPGVPGNVLSDLVSLPAYVLPSVYLTGKAGVKAAQGDSREAEELWQGFLRESALPALAKGDLSEAARRTGEHPLYTALELAGAKAVVGRGAGAVKRRGRPPEKRPPLKVYGDIEIKRGRYSKDAINELVQRARDRKRAGFEATSRQKGKYLRSRFDRSVFAGEQARRGQVNDADRAMMAVKGIAGSQRDVVAQAVQRIARKPETAVADLTAYRNHLAAEQANLSGGRLKANRMTVARIDKALAKPDPEALVAAANEFIRQQRPIQEGLQSRGLYDPEQTERASAIGFMRTHEGAGHGRPADGGPRQMLDREGNPLSTEAIREALARQGIEAPGFISNRPGTLGRGAYYRPSDTRATGASPRTTGKAISQGTSDTGFEAVARQFIGASSRLQQTKNFDHVTRENGLTKPGGGYFDGTSEGKMAIEHPEDFGMTLPDIPGGWTTRRVVPFPTRRGELEGAREHGHPAAAEPDIPDLALAREEGFMEGIVAASQAEGAGPVVLFPRLLAARERQHVSEKLPTEKTAEAITGHFKGAVLPTSPGWMAGNIADIYGVRTPIARITPADIRAGRGLERIAKEELTPDELTRAMESVVPGGVFGHVQRVQPHRASEQFVGTHLEPFWRAAATLRHAPGARKIGDLYRRYRDGVFYLEGKYVERLPQYGALSRHAREELGMTRHQFRKAVADGEPAIRDFVRGFRNQDNVDRAAKSIEDIYGNWGKNGPEARRFLTTWAPFWMWLRAATKFAFVTLPRDHPVLTAILAASEEMTREERMKFGLDKDSPTAAPAFLQGGIPTKDGGIVKLSNLTTFGMFTDYPEAVASMAAPQFAAGLFAAMGLDWKGDRLTDSDGRPASEEQRALAASLTVGGAFVPFLNVTKQIVDRGFAGANPARKFDPSTVNYLRSLSNSQQITVPISGSSESSSDVDYDDVFGGGSSSEVDYDKVFGGN